MKRICLKDFIVYNLIVVVSIVLTIYLGYNNVIFKYILFETTNIKFQELLSVLINILSIFVGAMITVATVLMSMCDKRILKLIKKNGKIKHVIYSIKISILTGILAIIFLAIIYSNCDLKIIYIRLILLYLSGLLILIFAHRSKMLIYLVINILDSSFENDEVVEKIKIKEKFKNNKNAHK